MSLFHPDMDLRESQVYLGSLLLREFHRSGTKAILIEDLLQNFLRSHPQRTQKKFLDAITFLYAVGLVDIEGFRVRLKDGNSGEALF